MIRWISSRTQPIRLLATASSFMPIRARATCALAVVALTVLCAGAVHARDAIDTEKAALTETVSDFNQAMEKLDFKRVVATIPPKVIAKIAANADLPIDKVTEMTISVMKSSMEAVKLGSFAMDLAKVEHKHLASGEPYALIPTVTVIGLEDKQRVEQKSLTLGLLDGGQWYLVRVSEASQLLILRDVYPEFAGVEFPRGSMEVLDE